MVSPPFRQFALVVIFIWETAFPSFSDGNIEVEEGGSCSRFSREPVAKPWPDPPGDAHFRHLPLGSSGK